MNCKLLYRYLEINTQKLGENSPTIFLYCKFTICWPPISDILGVATGKCAITRRECSS